jgi:hypothetical protein
MNLIQFLNFDYGGYPPRMSAKDAAAWEQYERLRQAWSFYQALRNAERAGGSLYGTSSTSFYEAFQVWLSANGIQDTYPWIFE